MIVVSSFSSIGCEMKISRLNPPATTSDFNLPCTFPYDLAQGCLGCCSFMLFVRWPILWTSSEELAAYTIVPEPDLSSPEWELYFSGKRLKSGRPTELRKSVLICGCNPSNKRSSDSILHLRMLGYSCLLGVGGNLYSQSFLPFCNKYIIL